MSPRGRDYIDIYFIIQKEQWTIEQLRKDAGIKFGIHIDPIQLSKQFLKVVEFSDFPKMLKSFNQKNIQDFFVEEARKLKKEIFE